MDFAVFPDDFVFVFFIAFVDLFFDIVEDFDIVIDFDIPLPVVMVLFFDIVLVRPDVPLVDPFIVEPFGAVALPGIVPCAVVEPVPLFDAGAALAGGGGLACWANAGAVSATEAATVHASVVRRMRFMNVVFPGRLTATRRRRLSSLPGERAGPRRARVFRRGCAKDRHVSEAVVVDALRTPMGRYGGALAPVRPDDLASYAIRALVDRTGVAPAAIDDVFWGAANQAGEDCRNVGRMATLLAGLPTSVPGATFNRLCGSGLQALNSAYHAIAANTIDVAVAGGSESMTRAPFVMLKAERAYDRAPEVHDTTLGNRMVNPRLAAMYPPISLGETAEKVAEQFGVTREDQDRFAYESQMRCKAAMEAGRFDAELVPVHVEQGKKSYDVARDEPPRPETTMETLAKLKPAFKAGGTVTAGNASPLNDGAAALLVCSAEAAERNGWEPLARFVTSATFGVDPSVMGIGPIGAVRKALERAKLRVDQIDLVELNEAFAAQSVACVREIGFDPAIVNVNGGAIALGHPLGCSGARIATTLLHELKRRGGRYGVATMCIGMGQGIATVFERV